MIKFNELEYKTIYAIGLLIASTWYFCMSVLDFTITMKGFEYYGQQFFYMEINPSICLWLENGIPPVYMFLIPFTLMMLSLYFHGNMHKYNRCKVQSYYVFGIWFATMLITALGILHALGFISWFYYDAF